MVDKKITLKKEKLKILEAYLKINKIDKFTMIGK